VIVVLWMVISSVAVALCASLLCFYLGYKLGRSRQRESAAIERFERNLRHLRSREDA
jgi:membrane protein DedA with SNARE-associated domain